MPGLGRNGVRLTAAVAAPESGTSDAPVETLRLALAETEKQMDLLREETHRLYVEFLGLPVSLGAVVAVLLAFRPEDSDVWWVAVLYAVGLLPLGYIVWVSIKSALDLLTPPGIRDISEKAAARFTNFDELTDTDRLPEHEWLEQSLKGWRAALMLGHRRLGPFLEFQRRLRLFLVAIVLYFFALAIFVPVVT